MDPAIILNRAFGQMNEGMHEIGAESVESGRKFKSVLEKVLQSAISFCSVASPLWPIVVLGRFDDLAHLFLTFSKSLLEATDQFLFFSFRKGQIIIGELAVLLLQPTLHFVPITFEIELCHNTRVSLCEG